MIRSMTGYGRYETENKDARLIVEIKSVNHRYCDISIRLPKNLNALENMIRKQIKESVSRGKIDVYITYENSHESEPVITYNRQLANAYLELLNRLSEDFHIDNPIDAPTLSRYPEVYALQENEVDEEQMQKLVRQTVAGALDDFIRARELEGEQLKKDLIHKLDVLSGLAVDVAMRSPEVFQEYKERLTAKIQELLGDTSVDEGVMAAELVIYSDKICVDEELVRLRSHIRHMKETLDETDGVGRKLDFIAQELNREANTTLSKANDIMISDLGIMMKTEIEKIREQIQNLE